MGNIMEFMCAQYSIVNGVLRRLISFSREHRTPRQLLQFWAEVARDMSEAATIDISYLLNDHGRVVRDIWLTEPAFTLSEESTPDGCFVYTMMKTHSTVEKCSLPCERESLMSIEESFLQYRSFLTTIRKKGIQAKDLEDLEGITLMLSVVCCLCVHLADVVIPTHMNCGLSEGTCGVIKGILRSTGHSHFYPNELPLIVSQAISIWVVRLSPGRDGRSNGKTSQNRTV